MSDNTQCDTKIMLHTHSLNYHGRCTVSASEVNLNNTRKEDRSYPALDKSSQCLHIPLSEDPS